jgi:hypothetical protein
MQNIVIKFKDKQLNNKDIFNILDLQAQIEQTVQVFAVAEAISSDNKIDNFMINQSSSGLHNDLIYRFATAFC